MDVCLLTLLCVVRCLWEGWSLVQRSPTVCVCVCVCVRAPNWVLSRCLNNQET